MVNQRQPMLAPVVRIRWRESSRRSHVSHLLVGDPDESGDYDDEDDDNSDDEGTYNVLR